MSLLIEGPSLADHPLVKTDLLSVRTEWDEQAQAWVTFVTELGDISTFGATPREALDQTVDLVAGHIETSLEHQLDAGVPAGRARQILVAIRAMSPS
ncbi:MAG: hypothetical protein ABI972_23100 [Acidobacteriota bacterium]